MGYMSWLSAKTGLPGTVLTGVILRPEGALVVACLTPPRYRQRSGGPTSIWLVYRGLVRSSLGFITGSAGLLERRDVSEDGNRFPRLAAYLEIIE